MDNCKLMDLTRQMIETPKGVQYLADINRLFKQLAPDNLDISMMRLFAMLDCPMHTFMVCITPNDQRIAGMVRINRKETTYGLLCEMNDLVVDLPLRGRGIGKMLLREVEVYARRIKADYTEWTSSPGRREAHAFYKVMGYDSEMTYAFWNKVHWEG